MRFQTLPNELLHREPREAAAFRPISLSFRRPSRRQFIRHALIGLASVSLLPSLSGCMGASLEPPVVKEPLPNPAWLANARVANFAAWLGIETRQLRDIFDSLAKENVNVLEVDLGLYQYGPANEYDAKMNLLDRIARAAHKWGMRCVAYYSTGEVITENAANRDDTMGKQHPDWLQVALDGTPLSFLGGGPVNWVVAGEEAAWMCPTSGFADYYLDRAGRIASTEVDGLWVDGSLFPDDVAPMPCTNPSCAALFQRETGHPIPRIAKGRPFSPSLFDDSTFRRWIRWRHDIVHRWLLRITAALQSVRSDFQVVVETVTCDNNRATNFGLDAGFAEDDKLYRVWEATPLAHQRGMRDAYADDWICLITAMKYGQGAALPKPAWAFTYGAQPDDAEYVMGIAINAGVCPFESKTPAMTDSVDPAYRERVFGWLAEHTELASAEPLRAAALFYSSASRDFLDRNAGQGLMYSQGDFEPQDTILKLPYLGDYRGCCRALIHAHVPYTILTESTLTASTLASYKLVVVPSALALSDGAVAILERYANGGGCLLVTGPDAGGYDLLGAAQGEPRLLQALNLDPKEKGWELVPHGAGMVIYNSTRIGLRYVSTDDQAILNQFIKAAQRTEALIVSDAPRSVLMDLRRSPDGKKIYLLCTSLEGLGSRSAGVFLPQPVSCSVRLPLFGMTPARVSAVSLTAKSPRQDIPFSAQRDEIRFSLTDIGALTLATVSS